MFKTGHPGEGSLLNKHSPLPFVHGYIEDNYTNTNAWSLAKLTDKHTKRTNTHRIHNLAIMVNHQQHKEDEW